MTTKKGPAFLPLRMEDLAMVRDEECRKMLFITALDREVALSAGREPMPGPSTSVIRASRRFLKETLEDWGFEYDGEGWVHPEFGFYVQDMEPPSSEESEPVLTTEKAETSPETDAAAAVQKAEKIDYEGIRDFMAEGKTEKKRPSFFRRVRRVFDYYL